MREKRAIKPSNNRKTIRSCSKIIGWCQDIKPCDRRRIPHLKKKVKITLEQETFNLNMLLIFEVEPAL
ncbi:hypothetical protein BS47DRAFT_1352290, partial [Hydnum rufescens UP504]